MKKNDLATPAGVDRDYNYLKAVERTIEDADKVTAERGIGVEVSTWGRAASSRQSNSRLDRYLERNSITRERAPAGMSRQKTNRTRMTNAGNVHWTVEWVDGDGKRRIKDDCVEPASIEDLYAAIHAEKMKAERRHLEESRFGQAKKRGLKRKREQNLKDSQRKLDAISTRNENESLHNLVMAQASTMADEATPTQKSANHNVTAAEDESTIDDIEQQQGDEITSAVSEPSNSAASTMETETQTARSLTSGAEASNNPVQYFYLLKPGTASPTRVLIPLRPGATLTEALRNHTVLEYPTIYVLPDSPASLQSEFMLETDYPDYVKKVASKGQVASASTGPVSGNRGSTDSTGGQRVQEDDSAPLDAKSILKMLKRDVGL